MATSTNYGWAEPDNSSLVKNGASDIRTLGNAIDTSVWNVGFGQAGKNKVINGDYGVWQRGTSFTSNVSGETYTADRWVSLVNGTGTRTVAQQTFTVGTAPVAGYEGQYFLRMGCSASGTATYFAIKQRIEDVRTFAGQTVTVSFYAKASASITTGFFGLTQNFGSGGSASVDTTGTNLTFTTSWVRYTQTFSCPSITGKTIGTGSNLEVGISLGSGTFTSLDIWGFQVEYGSVATPFQTASGGSRQAELAMCQRYYYEDAPLVGTLLNTTLIARSLCLHPVEMRTAPTVTISNATTFLVGANTATATGSITSYSTTRFLQADVTIGAIASAIGAAGCRIAGSGKITVSAEL
jgi:hypothetical protein